MGMNTGELRVPPVGNENSRHGHHHRSAAVEDWEPHGHVHGTRASRISRFFCEELGGHRQGHQPAVRPRILPVLSFWQTLVCSLSHTGAVLRVSEVLSLCVHLCVGVLLKDTWPCPPGADRQRALGAVCPFTSSAGNGPGMGRSVPH